MTLRSHCLGASCREAKRKALNWPIRRATICTTARIDVAQSASHPISTRLLEPAHWHKDVQTRYLNWRADRASSGWRDGTLQRLKRCEAADNAPRTSRSMLDYRNSGLTITLSLRSFDTQSDVCALMLLSNRRSAEVLRDHLKSRRGYPRYSGRLLGELRRRNKCSRLIDAFP